MCGDSAREVGLRARSAADLERKEKGCSLLFLATGPNTAAVAFDDALDQDESDARSLKVLRRMHALEGFE